MEKQYLLTEIDPEVKKNTPYNYRYIFSRTYEEMGKSQTKYVDCDFFNSQRYLVVPFYKPISTTLPKNVKTL